MFTNKNRNLIKKLILKLNLEEGIKNYIFRYLDLCDSFKIAGNIICGKSKIANIEYFQIAILPVLDNISEIDISLKMGENGNYLEEKEISFLPENKVYTQEKIHMISYDENQQKLTTLNMKNSEYVNNQIVYQKNTIKEQKEDQKIKENSVTSYFNHNEAVKKVVDNVGNILYYHYQFANNHDYMYTGSMITSEEYSYFVATNDKIFQKQLVK